MNKFLIFSQPKKEDLSVMFKLDDYQNISATKSEKYNFRTSK